MLLTLSITFQHFLQEGMYLSCFTHMLSYFIHVLSVSSQVCMVGIIQIVVFSGL
jgi:hypothetical protein